MTVSSNQQETNSSPRLSVVIVTPDDFSTIRKTVSKLRNQTVRDTIELIIVAPAEKTLGLPAGALANFASYGIVEIGSNFLVANARAQGAFAASTPIVAMPKITVLQSTRRCTL